MNNQMLKGIAESYGTPSYVFDLDAFTGRILHIKEILGEGVRIYYAMKANPFLTQAAARSADGLEVCSPGEYEICRRAGIGGRQVVLSGVNKEAADVESVMKQQGAHTYTAESVNQLKTLEESAEKTGTGRVRVLLRLTSGNQFGMDEEGILSVLRDRESYPHIEFAGLQYYSGTQKKRPDKIGEELKKLDTLYSRIRKELSIQFQELEFGPGFSVPYFQGEPEVCEDELLNEFKKVLDSLEFNGIIVLEMGRFLAAPCGSYLTRVVDLKCNQGQNYCIIDGGINHINYYGQAMAMKIPAYRYLPACGESGLAGDREEGGNQEAARRYTVCGSLCTSGDVLVKNLPLPGVKTGDLLVFDRIGAYSVTEGIYLFLSRRLPKVLIFTKADGARVIRDSSPTDYLNYGNYE